MLLLLLLVSSQRGQPIHSISLQGMTLSGSSCHFQVLEHMKTSKPGTCATVIKVHKYEPDEDICPFLTLKEYLNQTQGLRVMKTNCLLVIRNLTKQYLEIQFLDGLNKS